MTVRVVLVDDQALIRAGFRAIIDSAPDLEVVAEEVVSQAKKRPFIVLHCPTTAQL